MTKYMLRTNDSGNTYMCTLRPWNIKLMTDTILFFVSFIDLNNTNLP